MFISPLGCSCTTSPSLPQLKSEPTSAESFHEVPFFQLKSRDFPSAASNLALASVTVTPSYDACKRAAVCRSRGDQGKNRRGKGGELTLHQTRQTKRSFFNDNIFPPYSIVMSHVAVENVHGLEQQVSRVLPFLF